MTRLSTLLLLSLGICVAGAWTGSPASAAFVFTIDRFTDNASLTVSFEGADTNGDGVIFGFYPPDCGCVPEPTEITAVSVSFTGNFLIGSFSGFSDDFTNPFATLSFDFDFDDGFQLTYVVDPNGEGASTFFLPGGSVAGDAFISLGAMIDGLYTEVLGARCGTAFANAFGGPGGVCAILFRGADQAFNADFAIDAPEPMSLAVLGSGLGLLAVARRRRSAATSA